MKQWEHGGDIYRNSIAYDFSVNVNPLGIPQSVKDAMANAIEKCECYPDAQSQALREQLAIKYSVDPEWILCGNGASELFMAIYYGVKPNRVVIPVPSFYGYEYAMDRENTSVIYYPLKKEDGYCVTEGIIETLTKEVDVLVLASPNNPVGNVIPDDMLERIILHCRENQILVVLDQCFIEFTRTKDNNSMQKERVKDWLETFPNLILVRAFTKIFSIPGVRLGYLLCGNSRLMNRIGKNLPEWNVSLIAQCAGSAACREDLFVEKTVAFMETERHWLIERLRQLGLDCMESEANYVLFRSEIPLYEQMLQKGILIRNCDNYRGLMQGFYRIAVRKREENIKLLQEIEGVVHARIKDR